jgi:hypothetical protein
MGNRILKPGLDAAVSAEQVEFHSIEVECESET